MAMMLIFVHTPSNGTVMMRWAIRLVSIANAPANPATAQQNYTASNMEGWWTILF